ncbi:hypothetical protein HHL25_18820 [Rhizobium sp. S-51]|uniref:Uncharacterized protein n=1 Tax=Rhizobium terricola TaxID=2728849 RepID=A0A7Y0AZ56_9HYPH|nr:hypothetical protein [Rhizobium terricola]NML76192.1 hypothetical protein [Rhizobium terricola]
MKPYLLSLTIAMGFSWADFASAYAETRGLSTGKAIRTTIASGLFLSSLAFIFIECGPVDAALLLSMGFGIALLRRSVISSNIALPTATLSFAFYLDERLLS